LINGKALVLTAHLALIAVAGGVAVGLGSGSKEHRTTEILFKIFQTSISKSVRLFQWLFPLTICPVMRCRRSMLTSQIAVQISTVIVLKFRFGLYCKVMG
jgi:hypothetical protein